MTHGSIRRLLHENECINDRHYAITSTGLHLVQCSAMTEVAKGCHLYFGHNWHVPLRGLCNSWATCSC